MPYLKTKNYREFEILKHLDMPESVLAKITGAKQVVPCMPGDEVDIVDESIILKRRAKYPILIGTIELTSKTLYGHTSRNVPIYLFQPFDMSYPPMRVGCSNKDRSQNQLAIVNFSEWQAGDTFPRGSLIRLLGPVGEPRIEREALQWRYGNKQTLMDYAPLIPSRKNRMIVQGYTFNIDPPGCKDIDDVLTFNQRSDGSWQVSITIADVAEYVQPGTQVDELASQKGQTLYQEGNAVVPMLPPSLSEGAATLKAGVERFGLTYTFVYYPNEERMTEGHFIETMVTNQQSFTYEEAVNPNPIFQVLSSIASLLKQTPTSDPHEWIEEMMILYNKEAAKVLQKAHSGLLRVHNAADEEKLNAYLAIHKDLKFLAFESAKYCPVEEDKRQTHATLGYYAHASSPLRRYADIINQRVIKATLNQLNVVSTSAELANQLNRLQKNQKHHDRDYFFLQKMLESNVGELDGTVVSNSENTIKVYVPEWKRIVKVKTEKTEKTDPGQTVRLAYYADIRKPHWDTKMVFSIM